MLIYLTYHRFGEIFYYLNFFVAQDIVKGVNDRFDGELFNFDGHQTEVVLVTRIIPAAKTLEYCCILLIKLLEISN